MNWALSIDRKTITDVRIIEETARPLADGEARLAVDSFALTANNITYAAFGDAMRYWDFFPGTDDRCRLPVWGFADIAESRVEGLAVGERLYGYFPAASELIVSPGKITPGAFIDTAPHRAELPPAYNNYVRCSADPGWTENGEAAQMVLQPLFITAWLLDFFLRDDANGFTDAPILLTSASSKTAIALAFALKAGGGRQAIGLTSTRNADFVTGLDLYDAVTTYDAVDSLDPARPAAIVDFAGDADLNRALHTALAGRLAGNIRVGGAHWEKSAPPRDLPPPKPQFFFAPDAARTLIKSLGPEAFDQRYKAAWRTFAAAAPDYFDFRSEAGSEGALSVYKSLLEGKAAPRDGISIKV
ncbi:DUF2855 family protein [Maricaulis maris]|uniref:Uncharacterized protein DUF2855 n=1 Tax=Maricaulis maris TaxID=74318 RepID=A0A495D246_9PROT|nr:DUF2855 family protein [Maricaulis maris]RKQ95616.1 uncharacterized protein DUF2855 [Maricaulis maris]